MSKPKKQAKYARKGGEYQYAFRRCSHGHGHVEKTAGVRYVVCDVCRNILDNELNAKLDNRPFREPNTELAQAA